MNEFLTPERREETQALGGNTQTEYAQSDNIRIVVDDQTPPRQTEAGGYTVDLEKHERRNGVYSRDSIDPEKFRGMGAEEVIDAISRNASNSVDVVAGKVKQRLGTPERGFGGNYRNKYLSLILCGLFGFIGAHKFYEGKAAAGLGHIFMGIIGLIMIIFGFFSSLLITLLGCLAEVALVIKVFIDFLMLLGKPKYYDPEKNE